MKKASFKQPGIRKRIRTRPGDRGSSASSKRSKSLSEGSSKSNNVNNYQLVPYPDWSVILHHKSSGQVVLYNNQANQFRIEKYPPHISDLSSPAYGTVSNNSTASSLFCPTCGQPLNKFGGGPEIYTKDWNPEDLRSYEEEFGKDSSYFKLLSFAYREDLKKNQLEYKPEDVSLSKSLDDIQTKELPSDSGSQFSNQADEFQQTGGENTLSSNALNQGYYDKFFIEKSKLGKGLRGSVFLCQHVLEGVPLGQYAIKKVAVGDNRVWLQRMLREVTLLETLRHPNIIEYKHSWLEVNSFSKFGPKVPCLYILMECANGGNLEEYMNEPVDAFKNQTVGDTLSEDVGRNMQTRGMKGKNVDKSPHKGKKMGNSVATPPKRFLTIKEIWNFFLDICSGLAHLHSHGIIHRDLKPQNLLLKYTVSNEGEIIPDYPRILLTDFGECENISHLEKRERTGATGTLEFMAPELLRVDENGHFLDSFSTKADMWSLGMVLYYLCYSSLPFTNIDEIDLLKIQLLGMKRQVDEFVDFPKTDRNGMGDISKQLKWLMHALLDQNENKRPDIDDILGFVRSNQQAVNDTPQPNIHIQLKESEAPTRSVSPGPNREASQENLSSSPSIGSVELDEQGSPRPQKHSELDTLYDTIPVRKVNSAPESQWIVHYNPRTGLLSPEYSTSSNSDIEEALSDGLEGRDVSDSQWKVKDDLYDKKKNLLQPVKRINTSNLYLPIKSNWDMLTEEYVFKSWKFSVVILKVCSSTKNSST
ncbi:putative serine/threonine-protein kinase iks1 [Mycoemilia scoparia]|uniref:non-specific serine/threonine protein kinase n=1 Tax=Mycoemilia scoparia TaxID=417184 RepID=A0A9W8A3Y5_9FUNG|nr:putative serine/threonine-protein kinase iks1 [Mycoemilia scoparia]